LLENIDNDQIIITIDVDKVRPIEEMTSDLKMLIALLYDILSNVISLNQPIKVIIDIFRAEQLVAIRKHSFKFFFLFLFLLNFLYRMLNIMILRFDFKLNCVNVENFILNIQQPNSILLLIVNWNTKIMDLYNAGLDISVYLKQ